MAVMASEACAAKVRAPNAAEKSAATEEAARIIHRAAVVDRIRASGATGEAVGSVAAPDRVVAS